jgi:hypothetical protein
VNELAHPPVMPDPLVIKSTFIILIRSYPYRQWSRMYRDEIVGLWRLLPERQKNEVIDELIPNNVTGPTAMSDALGVVALLSTGRPISEILKQYGDAYVRCLVSAKARYHLMALEAYAVDPNLQLADPPCQNDPPTPK